MGFNGDLQNKLFLLELKLTFKREEGARTETQVVQRLSSKWEVLSSNPSTAKKSPKGKKGFSSVNHKQTG
jgi:hypothetical protein